MNKNAEVIMFALANDNPVELLDLWMHGEFDTIRELWSEFPAYLLTHDENESLYLMSHEMALKDRKISNLANGLSQLRHAVELQQSTIGYCALFSDIPEAKDSCAKATQESHQAIYDAMLATDTLL